MTEQCKHRYDGFGIILTTGMVEKLGDPAFVKCIRCDHILDESDILARLNATERLSAEDARRISHRPLPQSEYDILVAGLEELLNQNTRIDAQWMIRFDYARLREAGLWKVRDQNKEA